MGRPGAADETYRSGTGAVGSGGLLFGCNDLGTQCHPQIAVGIHAQEWTIALSLDYIPRTPAIARSDHSGDHGLPSLEAPALRHLRESGFKRARQSPNQHGKPRLANRDR